MIGQIQGGLAAALENSVASVVSGIHQENAQHMARCVMLVRAGITFGKYASPSQISPSLKVTLGIGHQGGNSMKLVQNIPPIIKVTLSFKRTVYK